MLQKWGIKTFPYGTFLINLKLIKQYQGIDPILTAKTRSKYRKVYFVEAIILSN